MSPSTTLKAQQNAVRRTVTLVEVTYGTGIAAMAPAPDGQVWVGGATCSTTLPTTSDAIQRSWPTMGACGAGFIGRMKPDGTFTYLSYFGGSSFSSVGALTTDASGFLYVGGSTRSADFPTTPGAYDRACDAGGSCSKGDGFIAKLSPDGRTLVFATYLGGSDIDSVTGLAVGSNGLIHVSGSTHSANFPVTAGALQSTFTSGATGSDEPHTDGFYARLSADGTSLQYGTYLGGPAEDAATDVALDSGGDAYVVGVAGSVGFFPTMNAAVSQCNGGSCGFLARFSASGPVYSTYTLPIVFTVALADDRVYMAGQSSPGMTSALIAEADAATGAIGRTVPFAAASATSSSLGRVSVDRNHVVYAVGRYQGNDCSNLCGPESSRYPTTWDAFKRQLSGADIDAVVSIVDFRPADPVTLYSTMLGGAQTDSAAAVLPDGAGGVYVGGHTQFMTPVNGQPTPPREGSDVVQSFVAHIGLQSVDMPTPPADIVLYAFDQNGIGPTTIAGDWKIDQGYTPSPAGGWAVHEWDRGAPKIGTPAANPQNFFETEFLADANVPYHLWMRMRADADSYQNDSVWVQFSDSVDGGGNPTWRIHSTDGTFVSLERCGGCGEQAWGWADNGYGAPGTPIVFATSGWHTIRIQQREDGVAIDQIVLSSSQWATDAPGAPKNDSTILPQSYAIPSSSTTTNAPPTIVMTNPANGATYTAPATITVTGNDSDPDSPAPRVDIYIDGELHATTTGSTFSATWFNLPAGTYTFSAAATDDQGATTTTPPVTVTVNNATTGGLPNGWMDADVGATGAQGSATFANGTFTVQGAGADVWGTADAFNYAYMPLTGDGTIVARVATVSSEANWVKAGVMIRSSLSPSSAQSFMLVSHAKGVAFQRRTADGNTSVSTSGSASTAPHWVSLVRTASNISAYESDDGSTWTFVGSDTFTMPDTVLIGLAVSSHVAGTLATATFDGVMTQSLPSGWGDADIGAVPFAGSANDTNGTFTVTGSGADIWGTADAFHYAWHLMSAKGSIIARVANVDDVSSWVKAGVMIRDSFDPGSAHAFVLVSHAKGVAFQRRQVAGGETVSTPGSASTSPHWVKLTRDEDTFTAYESDDGVTWTEIGSDTIAMKQSIYIGLAVTSHSTTSSATCTFDHVSIQ